MSDLSELEIKALAETVAKETAREMVTMMGFDPDDPTEAQALMNSLRDWNDTGKMIKSAGIKVVMGAIGAGILGLVSFLIMGGG